MRRSRTWAVVVVVVVALLPGPGASAQVRWAWPLSPAPDVVRGFDPPADRYGRGHRGVDLAAAAGAPVLATGAGRVSYAGLLAGRGVVVVVHGDLRTTYEPVDAAVAVGARVGVGDVLGSLAAGHRGCAAQTCLHWGLRRGEEYLDPLSLVGAGPVRLLPVDGVGGGGSAVGRRTDGDGLPPPDADVRPGGRRDEASGEERQDAPDGWRLRSAATPSGVLALAALLAGLWLVRGPRPPRRPGGTAAGGGRPAGVDEIATAGSTAVVAGADEPDGDPARVLDLGAERARRRAG